MTDILSNELVRKYFGCEHLVQSGPEHNMPFCLGEQAYRVLAAMQEPIRKGERCLERFPSNPDEEWHEVICPGPELRDFHPSFMRLPDRFQAKKECCEQYFEGKCPTCGMMHLCHKPSPAPEQCDNSNPINRHSTTCGYPDCYKPKQECSNCGCREETHPIPSCNKFDPRKPERKKCECPDPPCGTHHKGCPIHSTSDAVEAKITDIVKWTQEVTNEDVPADWLKYELGELVKRVRGKR